MFRDTWKCQECQRANIVCPLRDIDAYEKAEPLIENLVYNSRGHGTPPVFKMELLGVCPRCFETDFTREALQALSWWEKSQLGISFADAPQWMSDAFGFLTSEMSTARDLKSEIQKQEKKNQPTPRRR